MIVRRISSLVMGAALLFGFTGAVLAKAPCRDAKGKFVKCTEVAKKPQRCKDTKGRFAKCSQPGAKPAK